MSRTVGYWHARQGERRVSPLEARKHMFELTSADGATGAHQTNVQRWHDDFEALGREIARRVRRTP